MAEFSPVLSLVWQIAAIEAADARFEFIEPEHFFVGLCKLEGFANVTRLRTLGVPESQVTVIEAEIDLLMGLFQRFNVNPTTFRHDLRRVKGTGGFSQPGAIENWEMHRSEGSRRAFVAANSFADDIGSPFVAVFHLLAGLLDDEKNELCVWFARKRISVSEMRQAAATTPMPGMRVDEPLPEPQRPPTAAPAKREERDPLLRYGQDLTEMARSGQIHGGEMGDEILDVVKALGQKRRNNPLLLQSQTGQANRLVEQIAWHLISDAALASTNTRRIVRVDMAQLTGNLNYQGEYVERLKQVIQLASAAGDIILFIDGVEAIIGSGSIHVDTDEAMSALLVALADGSLQCIGGTSPAEYYQYIGRKTDLKTYFQPISLSGGSIDESAVAQPQVSGTTANLGGSSIISTPPPAPSIQSATSAASNTPSALVFMLDTLEERTQRFGVQIQVKQTAIDYLISKAGGAEQLNTRSLREMISQELENPLGGMILRGEADYGHTVIVTAFGGALQMKVG